MAFVHTKAGAADALDALNHGLTCVILQGDFQLGFAVIGFDREAVNVALILQNLRDGNFDFLRRHLDNGFFNHLCVPDACQHVGDRITHTHLGFS